MIRHRAIRDCIVYSINTVLQLNSIQRSLDDTPFILINISKHVAFIRIYQINLQTQRYANGWLVGWVDGFSIQEDLFESHRWNSVLDTFYFSKCVFFLSNTRQLINLWQQYNYTQFKIMVHVFKKKWTFQLLKCIRIETDWSFESSLEYKMNVGYGI